MTERAYTVAEIDRMREAVDFEYLWGRKIKDPTPEPVYFTDSEGGRVQVGSGSRTYKEVEKTKCVEELLRTYMLAGVEPEDLEISESTP